MQKKIKKLNRRDQKRTLGGTGSTYVDGVDKRDEDTGSLIVDSTEDTGSTLVD